MNFIDLFAGAGGLSEGFVRAGFKPSAHVEMDKYATDTLKTRTTYHWLKENNRVDEYHEYLLSTNKSKEELWQKVPNQLINSVINTEINEFSLKSILEQIEILRNKKEIDLIIGGPPCQAYSVVGRARAKDKMQNDPRNYLYKHYVEFLKIYKPKMFVFENVQGILSAQNGKHLSDILDAIRSIGYNVELPKTSKNVLNSKNFNVLQNRKRVIIIGWKKELNLSYPEFEEIYPKYSIAKDLFFDLLPLKNGEGTFNALPYNQEINEYLDKTNIRNGFGFVTQHITRPNNPNDLEIYKIAVQKWKNGNRLNYAELPNNLIRHKNIKSFTNRFQVVDGEGISHTVVAHISADGHYYIHPDINQNRSISVREAARIQSFPDNFFFEGSRSSAFKQIGNAVPPLMAEGIANKIKEMI